MITQKDGTTLSTVACVGCVTVLARVKWRDYEQYVEYAPFLMIDREAKRVNHFGGADLLIRVGPISSSYEDTCSYATGYNACCQEATVNHSGKSWRYKEEVDAHTVNAPNLEKRAEILKLPTL